jgi:DNA (cytosine-5)-methyltransferase 1
VKKIERRRAAFGRPQGERRRMIKPCFYDFFCGGGMVRAGLEPEWRCVFANDDNLRKGAAYVDNWGDDVLRIGDVASLNACDLPGIADLAWASFPCQDLSLAGNGAGLDGRRSEAFWGFANVIDALRAEERAPRLITLENTAGLIAPGQGAAFTKVCNALGRLDYRYGALVVDAADFLPQSRARVSSSRSAGGTRSRMDSCRRCHRLATPPTR